LEKKVKIKIFFIAILLYGNSRIGGEELEKPTVTIRVLLHSYSIEQENILDGLDEEARQKFMFLKNRGYSLITMAPEFISEEIYTTVYLVRNKQTYRETQFSESGITFRLVYAVENPHDPNFYVYTNIVANNTRYWFIKINFLLECTRIQEWLNEENGQLSTERIFF
jgi:hypothetical protein